MPLFTTRKWAWIGAIRNIVQRNRIFGSLWPRGGVVAMSFGVRLHVWGERACFTRPELKTERFSYDVITPSAARGILEAIHWKPAIRWCIDRIHVLKPIRFESIRRNEV